MPLLDSLERSIFGKRNLVRYGNSLGSRTNQAWEDYWMNCRAHYALEPHSSQSAYSRVSENLEKVGIAELDSFDATRLAEEVETDFQQLQRSEVAVNLPRQSTAKFAAEIFNFVQHVRPGIESYFESYFQIYWTSIQRNCPGSAPVESSFGWHIDDTPNPMMKVFLYLTDVSEETGAFRAFPKLETRELLSRGFSSWKPGQRTANETLMRSFLNERGRSLRVMEGRRGTALMFDSNLVHKGTPPEMKHRTLVQMQVYPSLRPMDQSDILSSLVTEIQRDYPLLPQVNDMLAMVT